MRIGAGSGVGYNALVARIIKNGNDGGTMLAREIMTSPAITVSPDTHIPEVARLMREHQISGLPVWTPTNICLASSPTTT